MIALSRKQGKLDTGLIGRGLEGFQKRVAVELQPSGVTELDAVLENRPMKIAILDDYQNVALKMVDRFGGES